MTTSYDQAAKAKLARDKASYEAYRKVDQAFHEQAHKAGTISAVKAAEREVCLFREDADLLAPEADEALAALRSAEDRAREAAEYARQQKDAHKRIKTSGSPQAVTDAAMRVGMAVQVHMDALATADLARKGSQDADEALAEAREGLATAERMLEQAKQHAATPPGAAPVSDETIAANYCYMQSDPVWDQLSRADQKRIAAVARKVRMVPTTASEVESFLEWADGTRDYSAHREAARRQLV